MWPGKQSSDMCQGCETSLYAEFQSMLSKNKTKQKPRGNNIVTCIELMVYFHIKKVILLMN